MSINTIITIILFIINASIYYFASGADQNRKLFAAQADEETGNGTSLMSMSAEQKAHEIVMEHFSNHPKKKQIKKRLEEIQRRSLDNADGARVNDGGLPLFIDLPETELTRLSVDVPRDAKVKDLADELKKVLQETGRHPFKQGHLTSFKFMYGGQELKSDDQLSEQGICAESQIEARVIYTKEKGLTMLSLFSKRRLDETINDESNYQDRIIQKVQSNQNGEVTTYFAAHVTFNAHSETFFQYYVFAFDEDKDRLFVAYADWISHGEEFEDICFTQFGQIDALDLFVQFLLKDAASRPMYNMELVQTGPSLCDKCD